jgi:DNA invertase Pin-like site-specific DNA recombinase
LEAQRETVERFAGSHGVIGHYTEIESGKDNARPILAQAIEHAKRENATLLIAKLDRLSRDAAFVMTLKNTGVVFVCCDMPEANTLTIGIMAVMAQHEREMIAKRTREGLQAAKARGVVLGNPSHMTDKARAKSIETRKQAAAENESWQRARAFAKVARVQGMTFRQIAGELNTNGYTTRFGKPFAATTVKRLVD